ncbi:acyltransferase [Actinoplanes lobatus]|uniref:Acyltransferase n=1 Tax=Actinoplanes lobatus TaxID=113568 RepID=A0A7W7H8S4_9ACTN|nr:acyltransferase family protein [Actinoplanes lobatus]MBB4745979.1 peptidoglycan/LPS O-acetylase OafA/YrhL [Actinoplanes lobatus]GGN83181.1 acyltransferase [Actinoplanes lobatus]GIE42315.1 acyltransferase [Actinoplanes lobatus]
MRAIAVTLVVLSHAGLSGLAGGYVGVDVFFVISGFLITTLLLKELTRTGRVSLATFYARRATRLLPASTVVLLVTVTASWLWMPATRFKSIAADAIYATFYGINWRLANEGVQYLNADAEPSPLQHFWSLAVEEQFYLVWPLLLLIFALLWGKRRTPVIVTLVPVVAASLTVSITQTASSAPWAYFGAHTRAWELAVGALVAVGAARLAGLPRALAAALTWAGLAAVLVAAFRYDEATPFPGSAAALPVLGAAAIIAGGCAAPRGGAVTLLGTWPFQQIGKYSYSWYLWHWPVLMIVPHMLDVEPNVPLNLGLAAGSLVLAIGSYHLVENPARNQSWVKARSRRGLAVGLALSSLAALVAQAGAMKPPQLAKGDPAIDTTQVVAAAADPESELRRIIEASVGTGKLPANTTPRVQNARKDKPSYYSTNCHLEYLETVVPGPCVFGDPAGKRTVYLLGDSHAAHWFPAVDAIAKERGWKLMVRTKSACHAATVRTFSTALKRAYTECPVWREQVLAEIKQARPYLVVISSSGNDGNPLLDESGHKVTSGADQRWADGWAATFRTIKAPKTRLVQIRDTPWPGHNVPECLAEHSRKISRCVAPAGDAVQIPARQQLVDRTAKANGVQVIDPTAWFCTAGDCPTVVGNLLVWRDDDHITTRYSAMLAPLLGARLPK